MARKSAAAKPQRTLEQTLWDAADKLRGNQEPSEYKHVVLGLVFLKYISDRFEERRAQLKDELAAEGIKPERIDGFLEDRDEYTSQNVFWVPAAARWGTIQDSAKQPEIGELIDTAMDLIEKENPTLKGVLPRNYGRDGLDKKRLGELVDLIGSIGFTATDDHGADDVLGRVYEYFLGQFAGKETGKDAGAFYTPRSVVKTLVEMLEPYKGRVYDPAAGSGGMFVQSAEFVKAHGGKRTDISVYGQEFTDTTWKLAKMNLALRGIEADMGVRSADSFTENLHPDLRADFVIANPPFNVSDWWDASLADDPRWKYGTPPPGNANFAWVQHFVYHLAPNGTAGFCWRMARCRRRAAVRVRSARSSLRPASSTASWRCRTNCSSTRVFRCRCGSCPRVATATATALARAKCCSSTLASSARWSRADCAYSLTVTSRRLQTPITSGAIMTASTRTFRASRSQQRSTRSRSTTSCSHPVAMSVLKRPR